MKQLIRSYVERIILIIIFGTISGIFLYGAHVIRQRQQPQYQLEQQWGPHSKYILKSLFSPDDQIEDYLINLIDSEKKRIRIAIFSFTSSRVANALLDARDRGIDIEIVADGDNSNGTYSKIALLRSHQIPLWLYPSDRSKSKGSVGIMHNKFIIFSSSLFDEPLLWTGSYNFTRSANDRNQENVLITNNPTMIKAYQHTFEQLKKRSIVVTIMPLVQLTSRNA